MAGTVFLAGMCVHAAGCAARSGDSTAGDSTEARSTRVIGVTLVTKQLEFYRELETGLRVAAARHGYRLIVTSGEFDLAKQQAEMDNFVVQHVDAVIACPVDSRGIRAAIGRAAAAHVPVFTADVRAPGARVVADIASDNILGGRLAAQYMARALGDSGAVAVISQPETQSALDRQEAFTAEVARHHRMAVVALVNGGGLRARALRAADEVLRGHPTVRGIFAVNDETALGALSAAVAHGKTAETFTIVGYDATPEAVAAIQRNTPLKADVAQEPQEIGEKTIDAIAAYFDHQPVDSTITVPVRLVVAIPLDPSGGAIPRPR